MNKITLTELADRLCFNSVIVEITDSNDNEVAVIYMDEILGYENESDCLRLNDRTGSDVTIFKNNLQIELDGETYVCRGPNFTYSLTKNGNF